MSKYFFIFLVTLISSGLFAQPIPLAITPIGNNLFVYTSSKSLAGRLSSFNCLYAVTDSGIVFFDCPWDNNLKQALLDSIQQKHHQKIVMCLLTHAHDDRTAFLNYCQAKSIATYSTVLTDSDAQKNNEKRALHLLAKDSTFQIGNLIFETFYPGPGHCFDNCIIWFPESKVLYGSCFIKSSTAKDLGNAKKLTFFDWKKNAYRVQSFYYDAKMIVPQQGDFLSAGALDKTIQLLEKATAKK